MGEGDDTAELHTYEPFAEHNPNSGIRETCESDIVAIVNRKDILHALQSTIQDDAFAPSSALAATKGKPREMRRQFMKGVEVLLAAACDQRVETLHYMLEMVQHEGSEVLFWIFVEVENQLIEAEEEDKEGIEKIFGTKSFGV